MRGLKRILMSQGVPMVPLRSLLVYPAAGIDTDGRQPLAPAYPTTVDGRDDEMTNTQPVLAVAQG